MGTNLLWNNQNDADQTTAWPNFKTTIRANCVVSTWSPLPPSIKGLAQWLSVMLWTGVAPLNSAASLQETANFSFQQACLFPGFRAASSQTPLAITYSHLKLWLSQHLCGWGIWEQNTRNPKLWNDYERSGEVKEDTAQIASYTGIQRDASWNKPKQHLKSE